MRHNYVTPLPPFFTPPLLHPPPATCSVTSFYLKRESKVIQHHWPQKALFLGWWPDLVIIWKTVSKESPLFMLPCGVGWRHFNHWRSANFVPVESRSLFFSWVLSPEQGSEDIKLDNGRCRWTIWEFSTTVALKKKWRKRCVKNVYKERKLSLQTILWKIPKKPILEKYVTQKRTITHCYCKMARLIVPQTIKFVNICVSKVTIIVHNNVKFPWIPCAWC